MTRYVISQSHQTNGFVEIDELLGPLPDVAPGESLRLTRTDTSWEVRRLRWTRMDLEDATATRWADAPEQDGD